eukprot:TRINITY_DN1753_c0_g1_i10.p1 TRINITY_DN1753_c0_g1~~TRINITY_DN1753_c0_g1_i10.p1  ORF type:complete len:319 (-),score=52.01 TRINITY_DN1753_c0_g1_i10:226-1182(-)
MVRESSEQTLYARNQLAPTDRERSMDALMKSTKISALMKELYRLRQDDRSIKSIVFSQWTGMLNLVETALQGAGILFARLDGNMSQAQRESSIRLFKTDSETSVILISLKAGGLGLNLPEASRVFMLDPWWNPAAEEQAIDRVHRLNQTRPVMVIRFIIQDSIEDKILELQEKKRLLAHGALSRNPSELRQLRLEDLKLLFFISFCGFSRSLKLFGKSVSYGAYFFFCRAKNFAHTNACLLKLIETSRDVEYQVHPVSDVKLADHIERPLYLLGGCGVDRDLSFMNILFGFLLFFFFSFLCCFLFSSQTRYLFRCREL